MKELGYYQRPHLVGYAAWIVTLAGTYFVNLSGEIVGPYQHH